MYNWQEMEIDDVEYNMVKLVALAWGQRNLLGFRFELKKPMEGNDVDDQPTPTVNFPPAREYAQLLSNFAMQHPRQC